MKKSSLALGALLLLAASCSNERPYTVNGIIQMPDSLQMGDTIIATPSFEGWQVYMLDLDGTPLDSVQIADNKFQFSGTVDKKCPYFVYLANDICVGMIAVEPGDIQVTIDEQSLTAVNTPTNDVMTDLDAAVQNLQQGVYDYLAQLTQDNGVEQLPDSVLMPIYMDFMNQSTQMLDSFYTANQGTLAAQYVVNYITSQVNSSDELLEVLEAYPDEIRESQLIKSRLDYLRQIESYYQMLESGNTADSTQFQLTPGE